MKITEFSVSGFRSLYDVPISDFGGVNIFFGDNNSGKSNILAAVEACFRVEQDTLPVAGFYGGPISNFIDNFSLRNDRTVAEIIRINCSIRLGAEDVKNLPTLIKFLQSHRIYKQVHMQEVTLEVEIKPGAPGSNTANRILKKASINQQTMYDSSKSPPNDKFPEITGNTAQKESAVDELALYLANSFHSIHPGRFTQSTTEISPLNIWSGLPQFKEVIRFMIESRGQEYQTSQKILGWFNKKPFNFGTIRPVVNRNGTDLVVKDVTGKELILERMGTGIQQFLMLLAEVGRRTALSKGNVFGIEELELNLSPKMQNQTLDMLIEMTKQAETSGFAQLFLTSHSPYLCREEKGVELYAVELDKDRSTKVKHGKNATAKIKKSLLI